MVVFLRNCRLILPFNAAEKITAIFTQLLLDITSFIPITKKYVTVEAQF